MAVVLPVPVVRLPDTMPLAELMVSAVVLPLQVAFQV